MHTILLTRIFQTSSDELQRFNLVQSHLGDFSSGITLWYHPLTTTDDGDVLSLLCSVKVDALKYFQIENTMPIYRCVMVAELCCKSLCTRAIS